MFAGLINQAKSAVSGLLLKYVARASAAPTLRSASMIYDEDRAAREFR